MINDYAESAENRDWKVNVVINRLEPLIDIFSNEGKYSKNVMYAITINYLLGAGYLGVPYAFEKAGIVLGTIITISTTIILYITALWVAEASHRGMQLIEESERTVNFSGQRVVTTLSASKSSKKNRRASNNTSSSIANSSSGGGGEADVPQSPQLLQNIKPFEYSSMNEILPESYSLMKSPEGSLLTRKNSFEIQESSGMEPEIVDLTLAFLGPSGKTLYLVNLIFLSFVGLLAYAQIFIQTITIQLYVPSILSSLLFGCIVVPLSCLDLHEQIDIQVCMFVMRCIVIIIMIMGIVAAIFVDPYDNDNIDIIVVDSASNSGIKFPYPYLSQDISCADYAGFGVMFSTAIFAQLFQQSIPGLIRPLSLEDKTEVPQIFSRALTTTASVYIVLGVVSVCYFDTYIKPIISLNFVGMTWGLGHDPSKFVFYSNPRILLGILSYIIVLFPALDILLLFPLAASTLGNTLQVSFPESHKFVEKLSLLGDITSNVSLGRKTSLFLRVCASVFPVFLSIFVVNISLILQLAGICGIIIALIIPALLQRYSRAKLQVIFQNVIISCSFFWCFDYYSILPHLCLLFNILLFQILLFYHVHFDRI